MNPSQIASAINGLPVHARTGAALVYGDHLPQPLARGVEIQLATALGMTLLLKFKQGGLVTILNPRGLSHHDNGIQIQSGDFLRLESFAMHPAYFLWEYAVGPVGLSKSIDGGEPTPHGNTEAPAFTLITNAG